MLRVLAVGVAVLAAIVVIGGLAVALIGRERSLELVFGPVERVEIDFATLTTAGRQNTYLVCPADLCAQAPDRASPVLAMPATELRDRWMAMIARQPRVERVAADEQALQYDFVQRSWLMRYPDTVTVRFVPLADGRSTLAVFSRSHYGRKDFGVNRARVDAWLDALSGAED